MILSHRRRFIFIHVAKTAGTTVKVYLAPHLGPFDLQLGAIAATRQAGIGLTTRAPISTFCARPLPAPSEPSSPSGSTRRSTPRRAASTSTGSAAFTTIAAPRRSPASRRARGAPTTSSASSGTPTPGWSPTTNGRRGRLPTLPPSRRCSPSSRKAPPTPSSAGTLELGTLHEGRQDRRRPCRATGGPSRRHAYGL